MTVPVAVLLVSGALIAYILAGYPLLLRWFAGREAEAIAKDLSFRPRVSILIAVHNGAAFLPRKLDSLLALDYPAELIETIVISDGSTDGTDSIAESYAGRGIQLLHVPKGGKARALNAGLQRASGEILFFTDVRQRIDPAALTNLVANFGDSRVGAVSGELRILNPDRVGEQADLQLYWKYEIWARQIHSRLGSMFSATGCIYAIRRSLAEQIPGDTLSDDVEIPLRAYLAGYRIILDNTALAYDYPTATGAEFRRRMRTLAGVWQAYVRHPALFVVVDPMRLHFLSHRFGRLVLPWALLAAGVATLLLAPSLFRTTLLGAGAFGVLLAGVDSRIPRTSPFKRFSSLCRTFLTMNLAALCAIAVFFLPPAIFWARPTQVEQRKAA